MPPVVIAERGEERDAERRVEIFEPRLPARVGRALHADAVEVVAERDRQVEGLRLMIGGDRLRHPLLVRRAVAEIAERQHADRRVGWRDREDRRRCAHERGKHRAALECNPALLRLDQRRQGRRVHRDGPLPRRDAPTTARSTGASASAAAFRAPRPRPTDLDPARSRLRSATAYLAARSIGSPP